VPFRAVKTSQFGDVLGVVYRRSRATAARRAA